MELLHNFASGLCHQLPEKSFKFAYFTLPFCARCTGVYLGVFSGLIGIYLARCGKKSGLPVSAIRWLSILLLAVFPLEVLTERFLPFSVPLFGRTYLGIGFGVSISLYSITLFNYFFWYNERENKIILNNPWIFILIILASIIIFEIVRHSSFVAAGYLIGTFSLVGTVLLYLILNLTIISSIPWFRKSHRNYIVGIPLSLFLIVIEITLIKAINGKL